MGAFSIWKVILHAFIFVFPTEKQESYDSSPFFWVQAEIHDKVSFNQHFT